MFRNRTPNPIYREDCRGGHWNEAFEQTRKGPNIFPFTGTFALLFPLIGRTFTPHSDTTETSCYEGFWTDY